MKEQLKEAIMQTIASWDEPDIYVVSLYVYDYDDDPCRPTVTVGYNTESYMNEQLEYASDEERHKAWEEIKKKEKEGREWQTEYLKSAMNESKKLIEKAQERKGFI